MRSITIFNWFLIVAALLSACNKANNAVVASISNKPVILDIDSAATYKITIEGTWQMPQHTVPAGNHFTNFIGMIHDSSTAVFTMGKPATLGVENIAEVGNATELFKEINNKIIAEKAAGIFNVVLPSITSTVTTSVNFSTKYSLISLVSMIAPSPDWFIGVQNFNLIQNGKWINDVYVNAFGYDAGTEDRDVFGYNNAATLPQQNISYLTPLNASVIANGNSMIAPFIRVRFLKK